MRPQLAKHDLPVRQLWGKDSQLPAKTSGSKGLDDLQRVEVAAKQRDDNQFNLDKQMQMCGKQVMADRFCPAVAGQTFRKRCTGDPDGKASQRVGHGFDRTSITKGSREIRYPKCRETEAADRPFIQRPDANHFTDKRMLTRILAVTRCRDHGAVTSFRHG
jgi:hypothetical protein